MDIFDDLLKLTENEYAAKTSEDNDSDVDVFIDTGSYSLNALFSGSIYGGLPGNRVSALAGEPATGKTFYALNICAKFLEDNPKGAVFYFESESAITTEMLDGRGIDKNRFYKIPVVTVEEFRTQALKIVNAYLEIDEDDRHPMFLALDSLGNLSTEKEISDVSEGSNTRDMTRAQVIKGAFRVLTLKLGRAKVPLLMTNHTYQVIGAYMPTKEMGGGTGLRYAASSIVILSKSKARDAQKEIVGALITAKIDKSRLTIEQKKVETLLDHKKGLNRYYGLLEIAEKHHIVKHTGNKYEFPNGKSAFESVIYKEPENWFSKDVLDKIDEACKKEFLFGEISEPEYRE